jgi:hypothetical protein
LLVLAERCLLLPYVVARSAVVVVVLCPRIFIGGWWFGSSLAVCSFVARDSLFASPCVRHWLFVGRRWVALGGVMWHWQGIVVGLGCHRRREVVGCGGGRCEVRVVVVVGCCGCCGCGSGK